MQSAYPLSAIGLLTVFLAVGTAESDALVVTQAMKASTIAEVFVEEDSIRVSFEIGLADLRAFRNVLSDDIYERLGYEARPLAERQVTFLGEDWVILADGKPLPATLALKGGRRVVRDEITGDPLPVGSDTGEPILQLDVQYRLATKPRTLTLGRTASDTLGTAGIGFMTYHRGLPVMDFRYLPAEATLDLDWTDPWYSSFRHRNLQRRYAAPLSAFLYVEPFEVRQEVIVRPMDLQHFVDLGLEGQTVIRADAQEALKEKVVAFLLKHNPVTIDGVPAPLTLDRAHFVRRTLRMTGVIDKPEDLDALSATLGVIFYAPTQGLPKQVSMRWELWSPRITVVPASATDEAGGLPSTLTADDPVLTWTNFLKNPTSLELSEIERPSGARWSVPVASLACLLLGLAFAFLWRASRRRMLGVLAGAALACAVLWPHARIGVGTAQVAPSDVKPLLTNLLRNVYRSFDRREDEIVYDRLAHSISGDLLQRVYLEVRRSMEVENQGGARVKVKAVELIESDTHAVAEGAGFEGACTWQVSGSVGHWGHVHQRTNQYRANVRVVPIEGAWKITALDVLDEERISRQPGG